MASGVGWVDRSLSSRPVSNHWPCPAGRPLNACWLPTWEEFSAWSCSCASLAKIPYIASWTLLRLFWIFTAEVLLFTCTSRSPTILLWSVSDLKLGLFTITKVFPMRIQCPVLEWAPAPNANFPTIFPYLFYMRGISFTDSQGFETLRVNVFSFSASMPYVSRGGDEW